MATKRRNLYLYLTLACFLGIIAIFIIDGYLGIYDTLYVTAGEYEEKIELDDWIKQNRFWSPAVNQGEKILFRYEVDNRRFSGYAADIEVSVWRSQTKISDLVSQRMVINAFDKGQLTWEVDTAGLLPDNIPPERGSDFSVIIKRGKIERRVIVQVNPLAYPSEYPVKPVPVR